MDLNFKSTILVIYYSSSSIIKMVDSLKVNEEEFEENVDDEEENEIDQFEAAQKQQINLWTTGGNRKDFVISKIIKYFSSLVIRKSAAVDSIDSMYEDNFKIPTKYEKAPNASLNVLRARVYVFIFIY